MGIQSLGLLTGTTLSATGGTAITLTPANGGVPGQMYLADASAADFRLRMSAQAKASIPVQQRDGSFSKDRRSFSLTIPLYDSVAEVYENSVIRLERVVPAFATPAQALLLNYYAAQLLFDADAAAFWATGSYA